MKNYLKKITILFVLSVIFLNTPVFAAPNLQDAFKVGDNSNEDPLDMVADNAGYDTRDANNQFDSMIGKIILAALSLLGVIFLILLIYAGYLWMTAAGNEQQVSKAQSMITTAIIGLFIVLSAYAISYFVLDSLTKTTLKQASEE